MERSYKSIPYIVSYTNKFILAIIKKDGRNYHFLTAALKQNQLPMRIFLCSNIVIRIQLLKLNVNLSF